MRRSTLSMAVLLPVLLAGLWATSIPNARADEELPPTSEFFDEYDTNADGKVTTDEFRGSSEVYRLLDKNGDGEITPDDLGLPADYKPDPALQRKRKQAQDRAARGGNAGQAMQKLYERVMKQDADKDGRVSRAEWKGKANGFDRLDRNKDGFLDAKDGGMALANRGRGKSKGKGGTQGGGATGEGHSPAEAEAMRARAKARFAEIDKNGDGVLGADEVPNPGFLRALDKDNDGSITEAEFLAFAKQRGNTGSGGKAGARKGREGRRRRGRMNAGMLKRWDRDGDGKVSQEEFPGGDEMFARLDADKDGSLTEADIKAAKAATKKDGAGRQRAQPITPASGTLIERQDTDGDGKLHRAEFHGSAAEWRALDRNGDGWVTADELRKP